MLRESSAITTQPSIEPPMRAPSRVRVRVRVRVRGRGRVRVGLRLRVRLRVRVPNLGAEGGGDLAEQIARVADRWAA